MSLSRGSKGHAGGGAGFRDINVTPLVDVMLVLLIVMMVTAPLLVTGLKIDLPDVKATNTPIKDAKLIVAITSDNRIIFGKRPDGSNDDVTDTIDDVLLKNERIQQEHELYISADKGAFYGTVARAVAAARRANVTSLNLLVDPEDPGK